jgi:hypothetical protein
MGYEFWKKTKLRCERLRFRSEWGEWEIGVTKLPGIFWTTANSPTSLNCSRTGCDGADFRLLPFPSCLLEDIVQLREDNVCLGLRANTHEGGQYFH